MTALLCALSIMAQVHVFPTPTQMEVGSGELELRGAVKLSFENVPSPDRIKRLVAANLSLKEGNGTATPVRFSVDPAMPGGPEAYRLSVTSTGIKASAPSERGLMWSVQTLRQLKRGQSLPQVEITDIPKAIWRGVLLDEGRHFMGEKTVKAFLDVMALYKFNVLHWHLTEDQGWRIEIKKYPRLTQVGGWRTEADGTRYGGFYTQSQIRTIVRYAADRGITIVPEIEMPGHCTAALAAYPDLGCRRAKLEVPTTWGVFTDVFCVGRDATLEFLEDVIDEVVPLFDSPYFHIGGDEVPKTQWEACTDCQARMKANGLADEHELQSWFIKRMQRYLAGKNRTLIGWDEIIDGGLAPGAVVQVWQEIDRALLAAKTRNPVILSPSSHTYLNRPAEDLTMRTVYEQRLVPAGLDPSLVIGHEVTLWSEFITPDNLFERFLPRGIAAAELFWSDPVRDWAPFEEKMNAHLDWLDRQVILYGPADRAISTIRLVPSERPGLGRIDVRTGMEAIVVRASMDGKAPTPRSPIVAQSLEFPIGRTVRARAFRGNKPVDPERVFRTQSHRALATAVNLSQPPAARYSNAGPNGLTDGILGSGNFDDGIWLGWQGADLSATLDLGEPTDIKEVSLGCLQQVGSWIMLPRSVRFEASDDGSTWRSLGSLSSPLSDRDFAPKIHRFKVEPKTKARFIRVAAESYGKLPSWHLGAGGNSWIFADELIVR